MGRVGCEGMAGHPRPAVGLGKRPEGPSAFEPFLQLGSSGTGRTQNQHAPADHQQKVTGGQQRQRRQTGHGLSTRAGPQGCGGLKRRFVAPGSWQAPERCRVR